MTGNGYIEIEINGRKTGLKFNMYAIERLAEIKGKESLYRNWTAVVYVGILGNAYAKQIEPELTFDEIVDWVDSLIYAKDIEVLNAVTDVFLNSRSYENLKNRANGEPSEDAKKKIVEMT